MEQDKNLHCSLMQKIFLRNISISSFQKQTIWGMSSINAFMVTGQVRRWGSWKSTILDNAIQPVQQYSNTSGKNSSDSALIIDTMDLLYRTQLDGFCIVSSDSDFTRLASRLRESDKYVLGMGESKTSALLYLCLQSVPVS